jgi:hypothetical protein
MLPRAEWKLLVPYYREAKEHPDGLVSFPDDYVVCEGEARSRRHLIERGLLRVSKPVNVGSDMLDLFNIPYLEVTPCGEDEARLYRSWFWRTGLFYRDHLQHHWLCAVLSFLAGIVGTLLVQWLVK